MKKSLVALAVAGAFAAPSAMAIDFTPTIYQSVALSFGSDKTGGVKNGGGGSGAVATAPEGTSLVQGGGRSIGFKVSDDLGNGMTAMMYIHWTTDVTSGNQQRPTNRNGYVGISGNFGTIKMGTNEHVYEVGMILDGWGSDWAGGNSVGGWDGAATKIGRTGANWTRQDQNSIWWTSPAWGGITLDAAYIMGPDANVNGAGQVADAEGFQLAAKWASGPFAVHGAWADYSDYVDVGGAGIGMGDFTGANSCTKGTNCSDASGFRLTGQWDFGVASIYATYNALEHKQTEAGGSKFEVTTWNLGAAMPIATGRILFNYVMADDQEINGVSQNDSDASGFDIGYQHDLSANTYLFVRYQDNEAGTNYSSAGGGKDEYDALMLGMKVSY